MLDNEPDENQSPSTAPAETPKAAPRRRRAASRPAGPPSASPPAPPIQQVAATTPEPATTEPARPEPVAPEPVVPEPVTTEPVTPEPVTPEPVTTEPVTTEPVAPEPVITEPGTAEPVSEQAAEAPPAKRAPRKRTTKKAAASEPATGDVAAEPAAVDAPAADAAPEKPTRTRAPRKRAAKKTAAPAAEQSADDLLAEAGAVPAPTDQELAAAAEDPSAGQSQDDSTQPAAAWAAEEAVAEVAPPVLDSAADQPAADGASPDQSSADQAGADQGQDEGEAALLAEPVADLAPLQESPLDVLESTEQVAEGETLQVEEPLGELTADTDGSEPAPLADAEDEESDGDAEDEDATDEGEDEPESREGDGRRRRRRRGGRRRRRTGGDDDADGSADDRSTDDEVAAPQAAATDDAPPAEPESTEDSSDEDDSDAEGDGTRRRRRRRRRRGEEAAGAADDPTEVVVRVREPRRNTKSASSEVTGIEGSTRMEAKRQRRRDGREAGRRRAPILSEAEFLARRESVSRKMIIRQADDMSQIAVVEDDILVEHYVDRDSAASLIGNVYLGRVQNVLPSMEAAFIDIGRGRNAVLYAGEVDWDSFGAEGQGRKVERVLKSGQTILVQVTKDPVGAKGARLTNHVSIPGRYIVYAPSGHLSGISRKLPDTERRRLKEILADLIGEASVIVRTAAEGASEEELVRDVNRLKAQWADIEKKVSSGQSPQLLYGEPDLTVRIVRDLFTEDFAELIIQGNGAANDAYDAVEAYVTHVAPHLKDRLRGWDPSAEGDLFDAFRLDEQIAKGLERKVFLPSGGSLVIDRTEAMTVIDVNTGKFTGSGGNLEATVTSNNLEAAEEIVNQLRLRDIGGIIVIDFIDMVLPANRELLLRRLVECLGRDRTRHQVAEVTSLGLVQMTRKKIGTGLAEAFTTECPHCHGRGFEIHELPVDSQRQADGGSRDARPRDNRRGGGQQSGSGDHGQESSNGHGGQSNGGRRGPKPPDLTKPIAAPEPEPAPVETTSSEPVEEQPVLAGVGSGGGSESTTASSDRPSRSRRGGTRRRATREQGAPVAAEAPELPTPVEVPGDAPVAAEVATEELTATGVTGSESTVTEPTVTEAESDAAAPHEAAVDDSAADGVATSESPAAEAPAEPVVDEPPAPPAEETAPTEGQTVADPQAAPDDDVEGEPVGSS